MRMGLILLRICGIAPSNCYPADFFFLKKGILMPLEKNNLFAFGIKLVNLVSQLVSEEVVRGSHANADRGRS